MTLPAALLTYRKLPRIARLELVTFLRDRAATNTAWANNPLFDGTAKERVQLRRQARALMAAADVLEAAEPRKVRRR